MSERGSGEEPATEQGGAVGGARSPTGDGQGGEQELASKNLHIQSKRFYLDLKQNERGRFIKVAEVGAGGRKSRLLLTMSTAVEFRDLLAQFIETYTSLGPMPEKEEAPEGPQAQDGETLRTEIIQKEFRRYYLDLKENKRGRFLKVSQTTARGGRTQIAIPAQGLVEFRDALTELLDEFGSDDHDESQLFHQESASLRAENKMFYFDMGTNRRGNYLRISEVRSNFRTAVTIPARHLKRFIETLEKFQPSEGAGEATSAGAGEATSAGAGEATSAGAGEATSEGAREATSAGAGEATSAASPASPQPAQDLKDPEDSKDSKDAPAPQAEQAPEESAKSEGAEE